MTMMECALRKDAPAFHRTMDALASVFNTDQNEKVPFDLFYQCAVRAADAQKMHDQVCKGGEVDVGIYDIFVGGVHVTMEPKKGEKPL